ncbi:hypothetical protein Hanom_Chr17g01553661 [Helianthus anomalus]
MLPNFTNMLLLVYVELIFDGMYGGQFLGFLVTKSILPNHILLYAHNKEKPQPMNRMKQR